MVKDKPAYSYNTLNHTFPITPTSSPSKKKWTKEGLIGDLNLDSPLARIGSYHECFGSSVEWESMGDEGFKVD
jgi:hypothetical protein